MNNERKGCLHLVLILAALVAVLVWVIKLVKTH